MKSLKSGNDFATLAKNHSKGPSAKNGGDLGWVVPGQMVPKFEKELFSLKDGKISKNLLKLNLVGILLNVKNLVN